MVTTIKESGFCQGVQNAINQADKAFANIQNGVYLFGDLVNNSTVMDAYRQKGYIITNHIADIAPGSRVIIRAHGVPQSIYQGLEAINATIVDCTCVKVKKIHEIVQGECNAGRTIVIVGKKDHPEVIGIKGWCQNNIVVETLADLTNITTQNIAVVAQTTCNRNLWEDICQSLTQTHPGAVIHNTLCNVVSHKLQKAADLAKTVNTMVIVGDKKSANSIELFQTCQAICPSTFFVATLEDAMVVPVGSTVGIVGSASAPKFLIDQIYDYLAFASFFAQAKTEIDTHIAQDLKAKFAAQTTAPFTQKALEDLYYQNENGKRIRGAMIKLGEAVASITNQHYLETAVAYELFQTAILIHDDIIDRSETRRGKETVHTTSAREKNSSHYGNARGICIGDYGLFFANHLIAHANLPDAIKVQVMQQFTHIQLATIEGEITDVILPYSPIDPTQDYQQYMDTVADIYQSKTAWYTIAGPLLIGAICGGGDVGLKQSLQAIAVPLGIAFQIKDDLLGMYASDEILGKPAISDLLEGKQTMLYGYAAKHATPPQKQVLDNLYGNQNATPQDLETVREIFTTTGAKTFGEEKIQGLCAQSLEAIAALPTTQDMKAIFRGLVSYLIVRKF